jgi:hypothetical protein
MLVRPLLLWAFFDFEIFAVAFLLGAFESQRLFKTTSIRLSIRLPSI